jgi:hypothetical protein
MADHDSSPPDVHIAAMTVRGQGLSIGRGRDLATTVAEGLARHLRAGSRIEHLAVRLPATVVTADGGIDRSAVAAALNHTLQSGTRDA